MESGASAFLSIQPPYEQYLVYFMIGNGVGSNSKCTRNLQGRIARILFGVFSWTALLGGWAVFSAQAQKSGAKPVQAPAMKPHEPVAGKACADCHKQVVSSKVQCLLAKGQMCALCHEIPLEGGPARLA